MSKDNLYQPYAADSAADFSADAGWGGCACGGHASARQHDEEERRAEARRQLRGHAAETLSQDYMEAAVVRALFPHAQTRRRFLAAVGSGAAMAAIASVMPVADLQAMVLDKPGAPEKKDLKIGFIPINCATPLILGDSMGFYAKEGLQVSLRKTAGWALVRDQMLNRELDASQLLAPMPLAISMGVGSNQQAMRVATIQNVNGQAITLALKHKDNRDPKNWKGFKFAIPFEFSMHNFLLRYYLAEHGIDPDRDVQLRVTPPAEMIANLRAGNIDGFLGPDPFNQRAVYDRIGFIHLLSKDIWNGHPCCSFGVAQAFIEQNPNSFAALYRAVLQGAAVARRSEGRAAIAATLAAPQYLNQPETVIAQALAGHYADGLGKVVDEPQRAGFDPMPWYSMAVWMLTQMKRWGYVKEDINYRALAEKVYLLTDARRLMKALDEPGYDQAPADGYRKFSVMGREFDPAAPQRYLDGFAIRRS